MPELPEVETVVRDLRRRLVGRKFKRVKINLPKIANLSSSKFNKIVNGKKIMSINRRAKIVIFQLNNNWRVLIHLKMTGQLIWQKGNKILAGGHTLATGITNSPNKYTHVIYYLSDKTTLYHNDLRQFGWVKILSDKQADRLVAELKLGPEPLSNEFSPKLLWQLSRRYKKRPLKALLLDQKNIAGLGNIYADESLYCAKIKPSRLSGRLSHAEANKLYKCIRNILLMAIKSKGTTVRNYTRGDGSRGGYEPYLKVYNRINQNCHRCRTKIKKIRVAGRGTHYCPLCQST
ncbi:DNA-formamidopyrimidine glycosylase [Patescibacteria group bacterium]